MENMNNNNKETDVMELSEEEMEQAAGGFLGFLLPIAKEVGIKIVKLFK